MATRIRCHSASVTERKALSRFKLAGVRAIGTEIGRGSFAAVVELDFHGLKCAGKKLHPHIYEDVPLQIKEAMLQRFDAECEIMSKLKHPNIVQFLGVHFEAGSEVPLLVMELLDTTLSVCLDRHGKLPDEISYNILDDVATALCYLHSQDPPVIHRDLTANNVLLTAEMRAKVSDLGVAKILTPFRDSRITTCPGTLAYMPPEAVAHNPKYDLSIDCFSYGVILLHVSCGKWPVPGEPNRVNPSDSSKLIPRSETERREVYFQELDPSHPLRPLINRCLSNHPPSRPSAEEILRQVKEVLAQHSPSTEDKITLLSQQKEENAARQEEIQGLKRAVDLLSTKVKKQQNDGKEALHAHSLETERLQIQLSEVSAQREALSLQLESKIEELTAMIKTIAIKDREVAAKDDVICALRRECAAMEASVRAKDEAVGALLSHSERALQHLSTTSQPNLLTPDICLTWRPGANMPVAMSAPQLVVIDGKLYVGGGNTEEERSKYVLCKYNPAYDQWSVFDCPVKFFGLGHVANSLVLVGGSQEDGTVMGEVYILDEISKTWNSSSIPTMPTARTLLTVISSGFGIAACGGHNGLNCSDAVEVYKTKTRQWYSASPLPKPLLALRTATVASTCFLLGGSSDFNTAQKDCYGIKVDDLFSASRQTPMDQKVLPIWKSFRSDTLAAAPAALLGALVSVGGLTLDKNWRHLRAFSSTSQSWIHIGQLPHQVLLCCAAVLGKELFVIGGRTSRSHRFISSVFIGTFE